MRRTTQHAGPSAAERIRTASSHMQQAVLAIPGSDPITTTVHHLRPCGDAVIAVDADSPAIEYAWRTGNGPAVLELTDRAPLPLREPVRSLVWLRGTLAAVPAHAERALAAEVAGDHPHPALLDVGHTTSLLRLLVGSAVVADASGAEPVSVDDLRGAEADPFWEMEGPWLQHLDEDHPDVVDQLARRLPAALRRGKVRPLAIDRYGISLRVEGFDGDRDVRLPFPEPAEDFTALSKAVRILIGCPFLNGLRSRG